MYHLFPQIVRDLRAEYVADTYIGVPKRKQQILID
jgi:hypothetical protein